MTNHHLTELKSVLNNVSRETLFSDAILEKINVDLAHYETLLCQWQRHTNLIANTTLANIWQRHIVDSLQLFPLALSLKSEATEWLDVGSGGGFPGLILAILLKHHNSGHITLIESNGKKASFLRQAAAELHLPAQIFNRRIEDSYGILSTSIDIVTARALADLSTLFALIAPFFDSLTYALLQKGCSYREEIELSRRDWCFDLSIYPSLTEKKSALLAIKNLHSLEK